MKSIDAENAQLHVTFYAAHELRYYVNGQIERGDATIRYAPGNNPKIGTHFFRPSYALKGRGVAK